MGSTRRAFWLTAVVVVGTLAGFNAQALAAPQLTISVTQQNDYGLRGLTSPFGSGESFPIGSGRNSYVVSVKNTAPGGTMQEIEENTVQPGSKLTISDKLPSGFEFATSEVEGVFTQPGVGHGSCSLEQGAIAPRTSVTCQLTGAKTGPRTRRPN